MGGKKEGLEVPVELLEGAPVGEGQGGSTVFPVVRHTDGQVQGVGAPEPKGQ